MKKINLKVMGVALFAVHSLYAGTPIEFMSTIVTNKDTVRIGQTLTVEVRLVDNALKVVNDAMPRLYFEGNETAIEYERKPYNAEKNLYVFSVKQVNSEKNQDVNISVRGAYRGEVYHFKKRAKKVKFIGSGKFIL